MTSTRTPRHNANAECDYGLLSNISRSTTEAGHAGSSAPTERTERIEFSSNISSRAFADAMRRGEEVQPTMFRDSSRPSAGATLHNGTLNALDDEHTGAA